VERIDEVLCGSKQHSKFRVKFVVALYKTGKFRWDLVWHYTRLENTDEIYGGTVQDWRFGVALYKTKSTGEIRCGTIQDWRIQMKFVVALYKTGEHTGGLVSHRTRLRVQVRFGVALYKTRKYI